MKKPEAIIFDMDGVLIDSEPFWVIAMSECFAKYHLNLSADELKQTTGLRLNEVIDYWKIKKQRPEINSIKLCKETYQSVAQKTIDRGHLIPGVKRLLQNLSSLEIPLGLASSSSKWLIDTFIKHYNIGSMFQAIVSADTFEYGKPHPQVFIECAKQLNVKNHQKCIVIEDSINGIIAAKAARMKCVAIPDLQKKEMPQFSLADKVIYSFSQLEDDWWNFI